MPMDKQMTEGNMFLRSRNNELCPVQLFICRIVLELKNLWILDGKIIGRM